MRPEQVALDGPAGRVLFGELEARAAAVAARLRQAAVEGEHDACAFVLSEPAEQVIGLLAALQSGVPALLLEAWEAAGELPQGVFARRVLRVACGAQDPAPSAELAWLDVGPQLAVPSGPGSREDGGGWRQGGLWVRPAGRGARRFVAAPLLSEVARGLGRLIELGPEDRVFCPYPLDSDQATSGLLAALVAGATWILPRLAASPDLRLARERMEEAGATVWLATPAHAGALLGGFPETGRPLAGIRALLLSAEAPSVELLARLRLLLPQASIFTLAGSVSLGVPVLAGRTESEDGTAGPGRALAPLVERPVEVVDGAFRPCPPWVASRVAVLASSVERSASPGSVASETAAVHDLTDLLARSLPDGTLEWLGQEAAEIELRGKRVFPGEVELALLAQEGVMGAAAAVLGAGEDARLVAFVEQSAGAGEPALLLRRLEPELPAHSLPSEIRAVPALPRDGSGLIDRAALGGLAALVAEPGPGPRAAAPEIVSRLQAIAEEILQRSPIAPDTDLLELGANSVDLVRIANAVESELGATIDLERLFVDPTLGALALDVEEQRPKQAELAAGAPQRPEVCAALILDPAERTAFKESQPGVRGDLAAANSVELASPAPGPDLQALYRRRRSHRSFAAEPIPLADLGGLLACLRQVQVDGEPKYRYPSAGGVYPVQVYLHAKGGRVEGLAGGCYYYHPLDDRLLLLTAQVELDRSIHDFINRRAFDECAFSLFLIGQYPAMEPMYGAGAHDFMMFEAGGMGQLLMMEAPALGLGLCGIGSLRFDAIRHLLRLADGAVLLHTLVGGRASDHEPPAVSAEERDARVEQMLARLDRLSDEEVRRLLTEKRRPGGGA